MENGVNLIFGKLPDVSVVSSHKLLRRLLGINEITSEHVTAEGIHLYGGFLLDGEAIYKAETEEEKKIKTLEFTFLYHLTKWAQKILYEGNA